MSILIPTNFTAVYILSRMVAAFFWGYRKGGFFGYIFCCYHRQWGCCSCCQAISQGTAHGRFKCNGR